MARRYLERRVRGEEIAHGKAADNTVEHFLKKGHTIHIRKRQPHIYERTHQICTE